MTCYRNFGRPGKIAGLTLALALGFAAPLSAQTMSGSVVSMTPQGKIVMLMFGEIVVAESGSLNESLVRGSGRIQEYIDGDMMLIASGVVRSIDSDGVELVFLTSPKMESEGFDLLAEEPNAVADTYLIDTETLICGPDGTPDKMAIQAGKYATVTIRPEQDVALTVRRGTALLTGLMGGLEITDNSCDAM